MVRYQNYREEEEPPSRSSTPDSPSIPEDDSPKPLSFWRRLFRTLGLRQSNSLEDEVAELIEEHDPEGVQIGDEERNILSNVLGLSDIKVSDIMIPRVNIVAAENNISLEDLRQLISDKEHTRIPVYKKSLDNVIGFVHIKDLIPFLGSKKRFIVEDVLREALFVPPSMKLRDLMVKMRLRRVHMAIVLDEYGGTEGLVTMEDVMEEIVGEIEDEHDEIEEPDIKKLSDSRYEVTAGIDIKELESLLERPLKQNEDDDYESLGGLIFFLLGRIPKTGEKLTHPNQVSFTIADADERRINRVLVEKHEPQHDD